MVVFLQEERVTAKRLAARRSTSIFDG